MSDLNYILLATITGLIFLGALALIGLLLKFASPIHRRWLEFRLQRRLARGSDSYFEERRDLESRLEEISSPHRFPNISMWRYVALIIYMPFIGLAFANLFFNTKAPTWVDPTLNIGLPALLGSSLLLPPHQFPLLSRIMGIALLFIAGLKLLFLF